MRSRLLDNGASTRRPGAWVGAWVVVALLLAGAPVSARDAAVATAAVSSEPGSVQAARRAARLAATEGVVRGSVLRVEGAGTRAPGPRLAQYRVRPGTEQPLAADLLQELIGLVRAADGFDDGIQKRCRPGTSVGFRLARGSAPGAPGAEPSELVLDFGCNRLSLGGGDGADAAAARASYFDPSRAAFVGLVKRALPDDPEIRKLR